MKMKSVSAGEYTAPPAHGPEDDRDLRHDARGASVATEDAAVGVETRDALLDARAGAVVEANDGQAHGRGEVHDLLDLLAVGLTQRAAEDREVLGVHADLAAVDLAVPGDHAVGVRTRVLKPHARRDVAVQHVEFLEGVLVEQVLETLSRGHATLGVMALDGFLATRHERFGLKSFEFLQTFGHRVFHSVRLASVRAFFPRRTCVTPSLRASL